MMTVDELARFRTFTTGCDGRQPAVLGVGGRAAGVDLPDRACAADRRNGEGRSSGVDPPARTPGGLRPRLGRALRADGL